jgi:hypothetical protein
MGIRGGGLEGRKEEKEKRKKNIFKGRKKPFFLI